MYGFMPCSIFSFAVALAYLWLGAFVFSKNTKSITNKLFLFFSLSLVVWGIGEGMQRASSSEGTALFWATYVVGFGSGLHAPFLLHFWLNFSGQFSWIRNNKIFLTFLYLPIVLFILIRVLVPRSMFLGAERHFWGYSMEGTSFYVLYTIVLAIYILLVIVLIFKKALDSKGNFRKQARNIGVGVLFSFTLGVSTQIIFPVFGINTPELTVISTFLFFSLMAYSMNKYGLLDITSSIASENILDTMNDYVVALDKDMKIAFVNDAVLRDGGYRRRQLDEKPVKFFVRSKLSSMKQETLLNKLPLVNQQAHLIGSKDVKIPVSMNVSAIKQDEDDDALGVVFVMRDMRELGKLINDLQSSKKALESKNEDLEKFNMMAVDRELKMIELKKRIKELEGKK